MKCNPLSKYVKNLSIFPSCLSGGWWLESKLVPHGTDDSALLLRILLNNIALACLTYRLSKQLITFIRNFYPEHNLSVIWQISQVLFKLKRVHKTGFISALNCEPNTSSEKSTYLINACKHPGLHNKHSYSSYKFARQRDWTCNRQLRRLTNN